ncbi:hypothetical protein BJX63DRAFT_392230, partial [Aspergillus granulosus]
MNQNRTKNALKRYLLQAKICPGSYVYQDGAESQHAGLICLFVGKPRLNRMH